MDATTIGGSTAANSTTSAGSTSDALRGLKLDDFLKLLLTELQNQDPLNPLESDKMLSQIGQIREIGATEQLSQTLDSVLLGQALSNATNLIGKTVRGLTDDGKELAGKVDKVSVVAGQPVLHIGEQSIRLKNVREVLPTAGA